MIYTIEKAKLVTEQLRKFTTAYTHHVVGQFANIEYWIDEVQVALKAIDEYGKRFTNIRDAQQAWIDAHGTKVYDYCPMCGGKCELSDGTPKPPIRTSSTDLKEARKALVDVTYYFLIRCFKIALLDQTELEKLCAKIGTSIDPFDLEIRE
ncbi:MAG: hypothetical protein CMO01_11165 [Thalassobius sp.]|nr:hypothetical protein [Thalassovita sp.]